MVTRGGFVTGLVAVALVALALIGCGKQGEEDGPGNHKLGGPITVKTTYTGEYPINVVCTTGMVADLARNIGGDRITVTQLMGEGVDPHLYKASPGDVNQ